VFVAGTGVPTVVVCGLGGTIAMSRVGAGAGGVVPALTSEDLVGAVPGLEGFAARVRPVTLLSRPSASLSFEDVIGVAERCVEYLRAGAVGVVVTQGTDTIEETSYLLDVLHERPEPIVVTGAMRNPTLAGADGPGNLLAALSVVVSPAVRDLGCLVVFADEIHAAGRVRKSHSTSTSTFASPNGGPVGYVVEGRPVVVNRPRRFTVGAGPVSCRVRVGLYPATFGDDGALLREFCAGLDGLVVAGFGVGHVPEWWVASLAEICGRIPVVLATRTGEGPVFSSTYGFPGSETDLTSRGLISAGFLSAYKARVLLHLLLARGASRSAVSNAFRVAGGLGCDG
jgi:L-asparaginase